MNPVPKPPRPAKKPRAWNSTLAAAEPKARPKKSLPRKSPPKKRPRSKAETLRIYGTSEFRAHLRQHPCLWCGRADVAQAHLRGNDGKGRKKGWETTGPLCNPKFEFPGCHRRFDRDCEEFLWFTDAQRTSILIRLDAFHKAWEAKR